MNGAEILECADCGSAFAKGAPGLKDLPSIYDHLYREGGLYQAHRREVDQIKTCARGRSQIRVGWERRRFFSQYKPSFGNQLLDIGCGTGYFLSAAKQAGWESSGLEVSSEARELGKPAHGCHVHAEPFEAVEFSDGSFAAVTAWEVLEHSTHPRYFIDKVLRLLVRGGVFAGSLPNYARPRYRYGEDLGPASVPPVHLNFWTPDAFAKVLSLSGFSCIDVHTPRLVPDLLRPFTQPHARKIVRFFRVLRGRDLATSFFFAARRPS